MTLQTQNRWPAIKRKTVSVQTVKVQRRDATTLTTSSTSIASFSIDNFVIDGYSTPYRLNRNSNTGGILLYKRRYSI